MKSQAFTLHADDGLFFRDGRPFGDSSRMVSGFPMPSTLMGALRHHLLEHSGVALGRFRSALQAGQDFAAACRELPEPWSELGKMRLSAFAPFKVLEQKPQLLFVCPTTLRVPKSERTSTCSRLDPLGKVPGFYGQGLKPLWAKGSEALAKVKGWIDQRTVQVYLDGGLPTSLRIQDWYRFETRTGIGIDSESNRTNEGEIYSTTLLVPSSLSGFYAQLEIDEGLQKYLPNSECPLAFGGESRRVILKPSSLLPWPQTKCPSPERQLLVLATPCPLTPEGQLPCHAQLEALALGSTLVHSGWNLATGGPRPSRAYAPAGTTLFFKPGHVAPERLCTGEDDLIGFGIALKGTWDYV